MPEELSQIYTPCVNTKCKGTCTTMLTIGSVNHAGEMICKDCWNGLEVVAQ
jgi:hypothetical protein